MSKVPPEYHYLRKVFNKAMATNLPLHYPFDCLIDFLPGMASPGMASPGGRLYSLSLPKAQAMKAHIEYSLKAGIIWYFSSPTGAGFFFVKKKDRLRRPYIDYKGLNDKTTQKMFSPAAY